MKIRRSEPDDRKRLYSKAERILDREIKKPAEHRDEALIKECEETMLYCARQMNISAGERRVKTARPVLLRRGLLIAAVLLCALAVSAAAAQTAGIRVWDAIIHWDADYLRIDYSKTASEAPDHGSSQTDAAESGEAPAGTLYFDSEDALKACLEGSAVLPHMEDLRFEYAEVAETDGLKSVYARYSLFESSLTVEISRLYGGEDDFTSHTAVFDGSYEEVFEKTINGTECIFGTNGGVSICSFKNGSAYYQLFGDIGADRLESAVRSILE